MTVARQSTLRRRDVVVATGSGLFAAFMVGMAYAAVPLYDWFCRTTGFGGTTQVATAAPTGELGREIVVRFDSNVGGGLPWQFAPERTWIKARLGEVVTMDYRVVNLSARETHGIASYNVTPLSIGSFFQKINCFCFTDQTLKPGEKRDMTVVFYVDPKIAQDSDGRTVDTITLSYSFFPNRDAPRRVSESRTPQAGGRI